MQQDWKFSVEYDNKNVPGHGTDIGQSYSGGSVILTRTGITDFTAHKIWQDESDKENRPKTDWTLWRYTRETGTDFTMAAQVLVDANNQTITVTATEEGGKTNTYKNIEWQSSGATVEEYVIETLPKYNSDGYEYIYFLREANLPADYVRIFGQYTPGEGGATGTFTEGDGIKRESGDNGVYDDTAVANNKTELIDVSVTKQWVAARYQNDLENIEVELTLMAKHKNDTEIFPDGGQEWYTPKMIDRATGEEKGDAVLTLSDFTAYQLEQTDKLTVDKYCELGHELEFKWVETAIYELTGEVDADGNPIKNKIERDGDKFRLSINKNALAEESLPHADEYFVSTTEGRQGDKQVITNTLEGTTEYFVRKTWDDSLTPGSITVSLQVYDSGGKNITADMVAKGYDLTKTLDNTTEITGKDTDAGLAYGGDYETRNSQWVHLFEDLPKYDENGNTYTYIIREAPNEATGVEPEYSYGHDVDNDGKKENNTALIHNALPGVSNYIDVRKVWLDDSVTTGRADCKFAIYAGTPGNGLLLRGTKNGVGGLLSSEFINVSADSGWWQRVDVTLFVYYGPQGNAFYLTPANVTALGWDKIKELEEYDKEHNPIGGTYANLEDWMNAHLVQDFYITEELVGNNIVGSAADQPNTQGYPITAGADGATYYVTIYNHIDTENSGNNNKICTDQEDSQRYYTVINRRIGAIRYTVEKKWNDGGLSAAERLKWDATLTLSCDEAPDAVRDRDDGYGYVQMPINPMWSGGASGAIQDILDNETYDWRPIYDSSWTDPAHNQVKSVQKLGNTETEDENGNKINSNTETVAFDNLPMYDYLGRLVHYSVTETMGGDTTTKGDYNIDYGTVTVGFDQPSNGTENQIVTNTRTANADFKWHLLWLDEYRYDNQQRPDIYLNLYYRVYQYEADGTPVMENGEHKYTIEKYPYREYLWTQQGTDTEDAWTATFNLPKYDDHGKEKVYYAAIDTVVKFGGIDYIGAQFGAGQVETVEDFLNKDVNRSQVTYDPGTEKYVVSHDAAFKAGIAATYDNNGRTLNLLESGNTFVEQLREKVNINGRKTWNNLPEDFPADELPGLTFNLYRFSMDLNGQFLRPDGTASAAEPSFDGLPHKVEKEGDNFVLKIYALNDQKMENEPTYRYLVEKLASVERIQSPSANYEFKMNYVGYNTVGGDSIPDHGWDGYQSGAEYYGAPMAKYDAAGNLYKYAVVETMPSDSTWDNLENAYDNLCGTVNGYGITNNFGSQSNKADITLTKSWDFTKLDPDEQPEYPDVTFTLYRFSECINAFDTPKDGAAVSHNYSEPEMVESKTLTAAEIKAGLDADGNTAKTNTVEFKDEFIYAPNGKPYIYFVVETALNGYDEAKIKLVDAAAEAQEEENVTDWPRAGNNSGVYPDMAWGSPAFVLTENKNTALSTSTTNKYTGLKRANLTGAKIWEDYNGVFGSRPTELTLYIYRNTKNTAEEYVGMLTITKDTDDLTCLLNRDDNDKDGKAPANNVTGDAIEASVRIDGNTWHYEITGLDGYNTDAEPYTYTVREDTTGDKLKDYIPVNKGVATGTVKPGETDADFDVVEMADLKNSLLTSLTVEKTWKTNDNTPLVRMPEVEMTLYVSNDNGNTWQEAERFFADFEGENFTYDNYTKTLDYTGWSAKFDKLPRGYLAAKDDDSGNSEFKSLIYRARETKIGDVTVEWSTNLDSVVSIGGVAYADIYYLKIGAEDTDGKTEITNTFNAAQFTVTKEWQGDNDNSYGTRGDADGDDNNTAWSVRFHIYRYYKNDDGTNSTPEILKYRQSDVDYVVTVSGADTVDTATTTIDNLPANAPNGKAYIYYAVELNPDGSKIVRTTAGGNVTDNYNGTYGVTYADGTTAEGVPSTTVTNMMDPTSLTVTKTWVGDQVSMRPANLTLTLWRSYPNAAGTGNTSEKVTYAGTITWTKNNDTWTATYGNLPKYNTDGEPYQYYVVETTQDGYERPLYGTSNPPSASAKSEVDGENFKETITNTATQFTLNKVSQTEPTESLNNVTLVFTGTNKAGVKWTLTWTRDGSGAERYEIKKGDTTWSSGSENAPVTITGLPAGVDFTLSSEIPPQGYVMPTGTVKFILSEDGEITVKSGGTYLNSTDNDLQLTLKDPKTHVTLTKKGNGTEITSGYSFTITGRFVGSDDENAVRYLGTVPDGGRLLADGDLIVSTDTQNPITYTIKEVQAPDGYQLSPVEVQFYLDVRGNVKITQGTNVATANGSTITFTDAPFTVNVYKLGVRDGYADVKFNLPGAVFELKEYNTDGTVTTLGTFTTNNRGLAAIPSVGKGYTLKVGGIYSVTEVTPPSGYFLPTGSDAQKIFKVQDDGTVKLGTVENGSFVADATPPADPLSFTDEPIIIKLTKTDVDGTSLANAKFKLEVQNGSTWTQVAADITTDANGTVELWDTAIGPYVAQGKTYRLTETKAPGGYVTDTTPIVFTVDNDGKATVTGQAPSNMITVTDKQTQFRVMKKDSEINNPLAGATLAIYKIADFNLNTGRPLYTAAAVDKWVTDGNGHTMTGLAEGEYVLYEAAVPAGFETFTPLRFTLSADNKIVLTETSQIKLQLPAEGSDVYTIIAIDTKIRCPVSLTKVVERDGQREALAGVKFDLYQKTESGEALLIATGITTNATGGWSSIGSTIPFEPGTPDYGKVLGFGLPAGDYYFVETETTADTALDATHHNFTVSSNGVPITVGPVVNKLFTANVELNKLDAVSGAALSGAVFTLKCENSDWTQEATTNARGELTFTGLPMKGAYRLTEVTAPAGYDDSALFEAVLTIGDGDHNSTVVINQALVDSGKLKVVNGSVSVSGVTNPRELGTVTLYKADGDNVDKALDGAEFTLYKRDEATNLWGLLKSFFTGHSYTVEGVLNGSDLTNTGKLEITGLDWGVYRLVETKGADGYAAVDKDGSEVAVEFTIDRDSNKNIELTVDGHAFYNYRTILKIFKQNQSGVALTGAEFRLDGRFVDETGNTVTGSMNLATDSKGEILLEGVLIAGETYTFTETKAPNGYTRLSGALVFRMEADGSAVIIRNTSGYKLEKADFFDNRIVVTNRRIPLFPQTGDGFKPALWLGLMAASLAGVVTGAVVYRKKKRSKA